MCTVNFLNIRTPKKFVVITLKFELCGSRYYSVMSPKDADRMANSVDPDQIWVCTVCPCLSVQKLRIIKVFAVLLNKAVSSIISIITFPFLLSSPDTWMELPVTQMLIYLPSLLPRLRNVWKLPRNLELKISVRIEKIGQNRHMNFPDCLILLFQHDDSFYQRLG